MRNGTGKYRRPHAYLTHVVLVRVARVVVAVGGRVLCTRSGPECGSHSRRLCVPQVW